MPVSLSPSSLPQAGERDADLLREVHIPAMKLYGILNCNTVKKARDWLTRHDIAVEFHDFKKLGLSHELAQRWLDQAGWEILINRKGLTWRGFPDEIKLAVSSNAAALPLMLEKTSVIKRPLLEKNGKLLHIGFDEAAYTEIFKP